MPDYIDLIKQEQFDEAIAVLLDAVAQKPTEHALFSLAYCLYQTSQYNLALHYLDEIQLKSVRSKWLLARVYLAIEMWDEAGKILTELAENNPSMDVFCMLAERERAGKHMVDMDKASLQREMRFLLRATEYPNCDAWVFHQIARLMSYIGDDLSEVVSFLYEAIKRFPEDSDLRFTLANWLMFELGQHTEAIGILSRIQDDQERLNRAMWDCLLLCVESKDYLTALKCLDLMSMIDARELDIIKADLFLRQGYLSKWLVLTKNIFSGEWPEAQAICAFHQAYFNLYEGTISDALTEFERAAKLILGGAILRGDQAVVIIDGISHEYWGQDVYHELCEQIIHLRLKDTFIGDELVGLVLATASTYCSEEECDAFVSLLPWESDGALILATQLLDEPAELCLRMAYKLLEVDPYSAIDYYLVYAQKSLSSNRNFISLLSTEYVKDNNKTKEYNQRLQLIPSLILDHLHECRDADVILTAFLPVYNGYLRKLLFDNKQFDVVAKFSEVFIHASKGVIGWFDYAYSLDMQSKFAEAEMAYLKQIEIDPNSSGAMNNLAGVYNHQGKLDQAHEYYQLACNISPNVELYTSNLENLRKALSARTESYRIINRRIGKIQDKAVDIGLTAEQLDELNQEYWHSSSTSKDIAAKFNIRANGLNSYVLPFELLDVCPVCHANRFYTSRQARDTNRIVCLGCGHENTQYCRCKYCIEQRVLQRQRAEESRKLKIEQEFEALRQQYSTAEYVEWALTKLNRREKTFLKVLLDEIKEHGTAKWSDVNDKANVVSEKTYIDKLLQLKLLFQRPQGSYVINNAIDLSMIALPNVRQISKSVRFNVFQRDGHTCQYCGRTPPEVQLVVDHLHPVSAGGTDDYDNLVTSCVDCNAGKSDKLILQHTGGKSKAGWAEEIHKKRLQILKTRRARTQEVTSYWLEQLGKRRLSNEDSQAISSFLERYEPDWIKSAIAITARKNIHEYIKYTAGILRAWAKDGPPKNFSNPSVDFANQPATEKQIAFIESLLLHNGIKLSDISDKTALSQLTKLDAMRLIPVLQEKLNEECDDEYEA